MSDTSVVEENMNLQDGVALAKEINEALVADKPNCDVIICTPFIHLASVAQVLDSMVVFRQPSQRSLLLSCSWQTVLSIITQVRWSR